MAYEASLSIPLNKAERISRNLGLLAGKCNLSSYDAVLSEISGITKFFHAGGQTGFTKGIVSVSPTGVSDSGYIMQWDYSAGAFKAYKPSPAFAPTFAGSAVAPTLGIIDSTGGVAVEAVGTVLAATAAAVTIPLNAYTPVGTVSSQSASVAVEAGDGEDCGEVGFIAIGFIR